MDQRTVLRKLLETDLNNFSYKLGLTSKEPTQLARGDCLAALNTLKEVVGSEEEFHKQIAILIVALLWTYAPQTIKDQLRQILTPMLSSIGFSPSIFLIDEEFREAGVYSPLGSFYDKALIVANDIDNSIMLGGREYILSQFQAGLWKAMSESSLLGISAPTSAGKSFLLYLKIIDLVLSGKSRFVYVVPTLSLIGQVTVDISNLFKEYGVSNIDVLNSYENEIERFVYIVTQERALSIFADEGVGEIDLLVVDEVQNIERVASEGPGRSKILYDVLKDVKHSNSARNIILSGPRLKNIKNLGFEIFGELSEESISECPPVLSLTYAISKEKNAYYLNQYSVAFSHPLQLKITNDEYIYGLGGVQYNKKFYHYLNSVIDSLNDSVNVIFSPTSAQARKSAKEYINFSQGDGGGLINPLRSGLADYVRDTVHPGYDLAPLIENGVAYHTGKTPSHVRKSIEMATKSGVIKSIFSTTTLMQGVNMPANNIIIRNPKLFTKGGGHNVQLSAYEFANLRGRAGRLLIDFIGRTVVLDEGAFVEDSDLSEDVRLFEDEYKEIVTGYEEVYQKNKEAIDSALLHDERIEDENSKHLLTHIRYMLYKYGETGEDRLKDVGIYIEPSIVSSARKELLNLSVPREIVLSNRYWDPLDLDYLYDLSLLYDSLPKSVWAESLANKILDWISLMREEFAYYFSRYIGVNHDGFLYGVARSAESWAREKPLKEILIDRFGSSSYEGIDADIDKEIDKLNSKVAYGLPMLLKPISDMSAADNPLIFSIENGVFNKTSKYLLDRGVPRETAIHISKKLPGDEIGREDLKQISNDIGYWEKKHIDHLLN